MNDQRFRTLKPMVVDNLKLREPQTEGFLRIKEHFDTSPDEREVGLVLPVGCGKSGLITLTPFATQATRALVIAPGIRIAKQLYEDFKASNPSMFYQKCEVLQGPEYPELAEIRGNRANREDLDYADVVVTNIQQIAGSENQWLNNLPADYFDTILFDEAHHNVAESWKVLREKFPNARIVNFSATPTRADGALMSGRIIYSFSIFRAMQKGYVKKIKAVQLNPATLSFVRDEDGQMQTVTLEEVRKLAETDAEFRRGIVSSQETLTTIVDASIRELQKLREKAKEPKLKIIAAALNHDHCTQIVKAYRARGMRADYVHTKLESEANDKIFAKLENHQLDVVVQVRMLAEGFDHPYFSVAAVFSVFGHLSPFAQFVGRIMRVIKQRAPRDPINMGTVVYHVGSNAAKRWSDFQEFSEADQSFFDQLLPTEHWHYGTDTEHETEIHDPNEVEEPGGVEVHSQQDVFLVEFPLIDQDPEKQRVLSDLIDQGFTAEDYQRYANERLRKVPTVRYEERVAERTALDDRIRNAAGKLLNERGMSHEGKNLDVKRLGASNFKVVKAAIDTEVNSRLGLNTGERHLATLDKLRETNASFDDILSKVRKEVFDGEGENASS